MSALQEVVQQLEDILKTSNQYGPFVCLDPSPPVCVLPFNKNGQCSTDESDGIQKRIEASPKLSLYDRDTFFSKGHGPNQQDDNDEVILAGSVGEEGLGGTLESGNKSNVLDEFSSCYGMGRSTHVEEEKEEAGMAIETFERPQIGITSQGSDGINSDILHQVALAFQVQEGGTVTADSPVPSTCEVDPQRTVDQLSSTDPLLQNYSESNVQVVKSGVDGKDRKGTVEERAVQPTKRKRGRPRKPKDPNNTVPKIKRPRGRPRKNPCTNVKSDVPVPSAAVDQCFNSSNVRENQDSSSKDLSSKDFFNEGSLHSDELNLEMFIDRQEGVQNDIDRSVIATHLCTISNKYCDDSMSTSYLRAERPNDMSRNELNFEINSPDELNNHLTIGVSIHHEGVETEAETAPENSVRALNGLDSQECDGSTIDNMMNEVALKVKVQEGETVSEDSNIPSTSEVNLQNKIKQISSSVASFQNGIKSSVQVEKCHHTIRKRRIERNKTKQPRGKTGQKYAANLELDALSISDDVMGTCKCSTPSQAIGVQDFMKGSSRNKDLFNDCSAVINDVRVGVSGDIQQDGHNGLIKECENINSKADRPDELHNFHGNSGSAHHRVEKEEAQTATENGEVDSQRIIEHVSTTDPLLQNCSEGSMQVVMNGVDKEDGKETGKVEAVQPTKRKRGRPRKPIDPSSIVKKSKRPRGRPRKITAANMEIGTLSLSDDQVDKCCPHTHANGIHNSNEDSDVNKVVLSEHSMAPTCTLATSGDTEKRAETSNDGQNGHSSHEVSDSKTENENNGANQEKASRQKKNDSLSEHHRRYHPKKSDVWEKETAAVKNAKRKSVKEQEVPKLKLRRKAREIPDHCSKKQRLSRDDVQDIIPSQKYLTGQERSFVTSSLLNVHCGNTGESAESLHPPKSHSIGPMTPPVQTHEKEKESMIQIGTVLSENEQKSSFMQIRNDEIVSRHEQCKVTDGSSMSEALPTETAIPKHVDTSSVTNASTCKVLLNTSEKNATSQTLHEAGPSMKRRRGRPRKKSKIDREMTVKDTRCDIQSGRDSKEAPVPLSDDNILAAAFLKGSDLSGNKTLSLLCECNGDATGPHESSCSFNQKGESDMTKTAEPIITTSENERMKGDMQEEIPGQSSLDSEVSVKRGRGRPKKDASKNKEIKTTHHQRTEPGDMLSYSRKSERIDVVDILIPSSSFPTSSLTTTDTVKTTVNTKETTDEVPVIASSERGDTSGNDHSEGTKESEHDKVLYLVQYQSCSPLKESEVTMANHLPDRQPPTLETLPARQQKGALPLKCSRQLSHHREKVQKVCRASGQIGSAVCEDVSTKIVSEKTNISLDTCRNMKKRGRGRPRKNRRVEDAIHCVDGCRGFQNSCSAVRRRLFKKTPDQVHNKSTDNEQMIAPPCPSIPEIASTGGGKSPELNHSFSIPDDSVHKETDIRLGLKSDITESSDGARLLEMKPQSAVNDLAHGSLSGKSKLECSTQETEVITGDCKSASVYQSFARISQKPVTTHKVIPVVCSSETEMHYSKELKLKGNQGTAHTHSRGFGMDVPSAESGFKALPLQKDQHRSMLLRNGCMKKPSVCIKKLPKRLISGPFNLDDHSRLARFIHYREKHVKTLKKKNKHLSTKSISGCAHQSSPVKLTTPLSSGGRVITPYVYDHAQSYIPTSPQKTVKLSYGEQNGQTTQTRDGTGKCLPPIKNFLKHPPIPLNSMKTSDKGKCLIMDRIKKDAALLQGDCFQNKEIQKKSSAAPVLSRAQLKSSSEKRGRGRPPKKFVSLAPKVKPKSTKFRATGPLLISKCLFSFKQKAVKDVTLSTKQLHGACVSKRRGRPPIKGVEHLGSTPSVAKSVETSLIESEFGKKFGRLLKRSVASESAISSTCSRKNQKENPTAACIKIPRKVGRPRKNPSPAVVHVPPKNSAVVSDVPRKPERPCKNARPADSVIPEKNTREPRRCSEVKRPVGRPLGSRTVGKNSLHVKRKVGRPRTRPIRLEYTQRKQELPHKSHGVNDSPTECLHPKSPIKTPTRKRGRPRKNPVEEMRPKYPSVPLPITDNFFLGGFGFQPSTLDGFAGTPSNDFSLPIEGAVLPVETRVEVEEMPLLESVFSMNNEEIISADSDFVPGSTVGATKESVICQQSKVNQDNMTDDQWRLEQSHRDEEPPELSCCISVTTEPLLPPPPSISIGLDATPLPDPSRSQTSDEAINLPATDVLNLFMSPQEEERRVPEVHQLLTEMA